MLLGGVLSYWLLPVAALPQVDFPTVQVTTQLPGANPDTIASLVTAPLALLEAVQAIDTPEAELDAELVHELRNKRLGLSETERFNVCTIGRRIKCQLYLTTVSRTSAACTQSAAA